MQEPSWFPLALHILQLAGLVMMFIFGICLGVLNALPSDLQRPLLFEYCTEYSVGVAVCGKVAIA